jgi:flagellar hook-associated protein 2
MSGVSSSTSGTTSSATTTTPGTNVPPVTFPGVVSGIDYTSIIQKLTSATLIPAVQDQSKITQINAQNAELIKINNLMQSLQNSLTALSDPATFTSYSATSSDPSAVTGTDNGTGAASSGTYTITETSLATATSITSAYSTVYGASMAGYENTPLANAPTAITATNGTTGQGSVTIDGVQISYNVNVDSLSTVLSKIQASVDASADAGFVASYNPTTDEVTFSSTDGKTISLGSSTDSGNLLTVLKLDTAYVNNSASTPTVTSSGPIGGLNESATFNSANAAGLLTSVTTVASAAVVAKEGDFFTINGVQIDIDPATENLASVLQSINTSSAGVTASYSVITNQVTLTSKSTGPESIVLGSAATGDTSNFLAAVGLEPSEGATTSVGQQASVTVAGANGIPHTFYSNTNTIADAIPGLNVTVAEDSTATNTLTVGQNVSLAVSAINTFVSAYNAVVNELDNALAPPVVKQDDAELSVSTGVTSTSSEVASGGVLYGDFEASQILDNLINFGSTFLSDNGNSYNSLSSIGLNLDSSHSVLTDGSSDASDSSDSSSVSSDATDGLSVTTEDGTSGQLLPLDVAQFTAAFTADPTAVANIFQDSSQGLVQQLGSYLTTVTGFPTNVSTGLLGSVPSVSLIQADENQNTSRIASLQDFIKTIDDEANAQANLLRAEYTSSESLIAGYQAVQGQISQL